MLSSEDQEKILNVLRGRFSAFEIDPKSKKASNMEVEFLAGAMAAINALRPNPDPSKISEDCPPFWVMSIMSGRRVVTDIERR